MRYRLRTLLILLTILPPILAVSWGKYSAWRVEHERQRKVEELWAEGLLQDMHAKTTRNAKFLATMFQVEKMMEGTDTSEEPIFSFPLSDKLQHRLEKRKSMP